MYKIIDSGGFKKLEQVGSYRIVRPSPQSVWAPSLASKDWSDVDAVFERFSGGDGAWTYHNPEIRQPFEVSIDQWKFLIKCTDFGHLGIFAEQRDNWNRLHRLIQKRVAGREFKVLNLFAYTGGMTIACAAGGAKVVHIDASKTSVSWARENAGIGGMSELPIRWIVEDVKKFVARELKRGSRYQGIVLDPPSFGRGNKNEVWKIESDLVGLLVQLNELLAEDFEFILLSAHSNGYTPQALTNLLQQTIKQTGCDFKHGEMLIPFGSGQSMLPSGAYSLMSKSLIDE